MIYELIKITYYSIYAEKDYLDRLLHGEWSDKQSINLFCLL